MWRFLENFSLFFFPFFYYYFFNLRKESQKLGVPVFGKWKSKLFFAIPTHVYAVFVSWGDWKKKKKGIKKYWKMIIKVNQILLALFSLNKLLIAEQHLNNNFSIEVWSLLTYK